METCYALIASDPPELAFELPCQACGCHAVFTANAPLGARSSPLVLRCLQCGSERADLADFYAAATARE